MASRQGVLPGTMLVCEGFGTTRGAPFRLSDEAYARPNRARAGTVLADLSHGFALPESARLTHERKSDMAQQGYQDRGNGSSRERGSGTGTDDDRGYESDRDSRNRGSQDSQQSSFSDRDEQMGDYYTGGSRNFGGGQGNYGSGGGSSDWGRGQGGGTDWRNAPGGY